LNHPMDARYTSNRKQAACATKSTAA
jgi:hypothetical protein